jgi:hypothetical protein
VSQNLATHTTPAMHSEQLLKPTTPVSNSEQPSMPIMPILNSEPPIKSKHELMDSYKIQSLDFSQNPANPTTPAFNSEQSRTFKHLLLPVLNSDQSWKSKYLLMKKPAATLNSTDRYSRQHISFSTGNFHGPSSLWIFYRIVSEAVRKKEDSQHALIDCLGLNICRFI